MAASSATLYFGFLIASITLWMIFRLFTWMLSLVLGMSVRFRVSSRKCLRDVVVMSETGAFESSSAGEIKFGVGFLSGELCIKVMIYDLDVVMRSSGALSCDKLTLCFQLGYDRAVGIVVIRTMEIVSGDVTMKLDNDFFSQSKRSSATSPSTKKPHKEYQLSALAKYSMYFSEKVSFSLPKLDVRCVNRKHDLFAVNNVTAIILRSIKSKSVEDSGDITRLMELNEIHLFREAESSILEIIKVDVVSFIEIPFQPVLPINANLEIELGGTQCNLFISRLEPWLSLLFPEKRTLVVQEEICTREKLKAADMKTIMWTCTFSAPEMTMLCGIDDLPLYHVSISNLPLIFILYFFFSKNCSSLSMFLLLTAFLPPLFISSKNIGLYMNF
ncbi:hypothetical protein Bca4012_092340 [Brassica carinata]|uniref:Uncharacterized protein n=2 Tax=Brassica TaxID=3705 RepID=A0A3P6G405_BRAOL|nr:unnamed protein product [Brassica napus]VDD54324.1 unnamed protein product [Brassica oleracea]